MSIADEVPGEAKDGVPTGGPAPGGTAEEQAETLEAKVEAARDDLGQLVSELDRRRHRLTKSLAKGAITVAVVAVGGYVLWRVLRSRRSRMTSKRGFPKRWASARTA